MAPISEFVLGSPASSVTKELKLPTKGEKEAFSEGITTLVNGGAHCVFDTPYTYNQEIFPAGVIITAGKSDLSRLSQILKKEFSRAHPSMSGEPDYKQSIALLPSPPGESRKGALYVSETVVGILTAFSSVETIKNLIRDEEKRDRINSATR